MMELVAVTKLAAGLRQRALAAARSYATQSSAARRSLQQPVRGMRDELPADCRRKRFVEDRARAVAERYGYGEVRTPVLEFTQVFARTLGQVKPPPALVDPAAVESPRSLPTLPPSVLPQDSDVVGKEMYTFADRNDASVTLRPENTAGIMRALLCSKQHASEVQKWYCRAAPNAHTPRLPRSVSHVPHALRPLCLAH